MKLNFNNKITIILIFLFLISRIYILLNPPLYYSDVTQDYERYANMWWYGLPPYLKHLYEYPPATIPFLTFPLLFDQLGIGKFYINYRIGIFLFEIFLFIFILKFLQKQKTKNLSKIISILFFILIPIIAKDFYYEGIDLIFSGTLAISLISFFLYDQKKLRNRICTYTIFWWSFALKFMSLPILPIIFLTKKIKLKKEVIALILGFLLIWIVPLIFYRSSLQVSYYFHKDRPLKYSSFGDYVIRTINFFTNSETRTSLSPDFAMTGPISNQINQIFKLIFPLSILSMLIYSVIYLSSKISKTKEKFIEKIKNIYKLIFDKIIIPENFNIYNYLIKTTLIYICILFFTNKTISQPFAIWFIPLISIIPFNNLKNQIKFILVTSIFITIMTSPLLSFLNKEKIIIYPFTYSWLLDTIRFITMVLILTFSFKLNTQNEIK